MAATISCDLAIVGGGLAGGLIALALRARRPDLDIRIVEGGARFGGNHIWSFFASDLDASGQHFLAPLVGHRWPAYDIRFPAHRRTLGTGYASIESESLDAALRRALPDHARMTGRKVLATSATAVVLADGDRIAAEGVIDARGAGDLDLLDIGWQKFRGRRLTLDSPHGRAWPVVMDATVEQVDGYRFVYLLPVAPDAMFVEDTYYSDAPDLDVPVLDRRIDAYAAAQGWTVVDSTRAETGALPVTMGGDFDAYWRSTGARVAKAGVRAGLFHPTTGYSLPDAVRTAFLIAAATDLSGAGLHDLTYRYAADAWARRGFYRMLDRMLFRAAEPAERYRVLQRFYRLPPALIGRFYAGRSTMMDRMRVLTGKPPVPIGRAIRAIRSERT